VVRRPGVELHALQGQERHLTDVVAVAGIDEREQVGLDVLDLGRAHQEHAVHPVQQLVELGPRRPELEHPVLSTGRQALGVGRTADGSDHRLTAP
jgi:hypothetical protein